MARPFMFAALCQRAHPLKHSLAESIFVSRVQKAAKKSSLAEKNSLAGSLVSRGITVLISKFLNLKFLESQITVLGVETAIPNIRTAATLHSLVDVVHRFASSSQAWLTTWPANPPPHIVKYGVGWRVSRDRCQLRPLRAQDPIHVETTQANANSGTILSCFTKANLNTACTSCICTVTCYKLVFRKYKKLPTYKPLRHIRRWRNNSMNSKPKH